MELLTGDDLTELLGVDAARRPAIAITLARYCEPHRGYHDLADIVLRAELAPAVQDQALAALKLLAPER